MATSADYIEFVMEQLEAAYTGLDLWYRPMFGEYCIYAGEKPLYLVCDNTVFVKRLECVSQLLSNAEARAPFPGAKDFVVVDVEDSATLREVTLLLHLHKPMPKPKRRKTAIAKTKEHNPK